MRKLLISMGFVATCGLLSSPGPAAAQGFGQVTFGSTATPAATPAEKAADASKPHNLDGVTVTGKRVPDSQKDPTEVLCHKETPIGSRFPVEVCATRRQYAERRMIDQEQLYEWTQGKPLKSN
ncbi:hypothetical protein [Phenylobacterium sp.]|uniref:hypothetical protein n=1 Tax=Phenylobacterium sp. TaxID=1871053 RepID=UPI002CAB9004|nr:hypothetical protein [Phenylobacterium sp.]HLZ73905.1 hypothetical protein [Phenylobacterium sp.]